MILCLGSTLQAWAGDGHGSDWIGADELCGRGKYAAAAERARASSDPDADALLAYLERRREQPDPEGLRLLLGEADKLLAQEDGEGALALLKEAAPHERTVLAVRTASAQGAALQAMGQLEESAGAYRMAADEAEAIGWRTGAVEALFQSGLSALYARSFEAARTQWHRVHVLQRELGNAAGAASSLANVALVAQEQGDYASAKVFYEQALQELEALGDERTQAITLGNLGWLHDRLGDFAVALALEEKGLEIARRIGDRRGEAEIRGHLGSISSDVGQYEAALAHQEAALQIFEALLEVEQTPDNLEGVARAHGNIGNAYFFLGDLEAYEARQKQALEIFDQLGDPASAAISLGNLAEAYAKRKDYDEALKLHQAAIVRLTDAGDRLAAAHARGAMGLTLRESGKLEEALAEHEKALAEATALGAKDYVIDQLQGIAKVHLTAGRTEEALASAKAGMELMKTTAGSLSQAGGASARARRAELFATGIQAAARAGDEDACALFLEGGRAGTLLEALGGRDALKAAIVPPELTAALVEAQTRELQALGRWRATKREGLRRVTRARLKELRAAEAVTLAATQRLERAQKAAAHVVYPDPDDLETIAGRVREGEALVIYSLLAEQAVALVVTSKTSRIVQLGDSEKIVDACNELLLAKRPHVDPDKFGSVGKLVVKPLALSAETTRVLISPDGILAYVPFLPLLGEREVLFVPSGTTLGLLRKEGASRGSKVLALGDPDYSSDVDEGALGIYAPGSNGPLMRLEASRAEAEAVGDVVLLDEDASEDGLVEALKKHPTRWRAVHLCCHGLANAEHPALSSLALTKAGDNDGFLTAFEVFRMRIPADLVVLAACASSRGKLVKAEGLLGLTRAFMFAGAPRVIASLWNVDDEATLALMKRFYELWHPQEGEGLSVAEALKEAQEFVRDHEEEDWSHPYFWAAWVLWGLPE